MNSNLPTKTNPNPYSKAGLFSKLFFLWIIPTFRKGYSNGIQMGDLFENLDDEKSETLGDQLETIWESQLQLQKLKGEVPSLTRALWTLCGFRYTLTVFVFTIIEQCFRISQPILLLKLLQSLDRPESDSYHPYVYTAGICLTTAGVMLIYHPMYFFTMRIGMKCRVACSSLMYRKTLRLSNGATKQTNLGQLTNLLSTDVSRFESNLLFVRYIPSSILQLLVFTGLLWYQYGSLCWIAIGTSVALLPFLFWNVKWYLTLRQKVAKRGDARGSFMSEMIMGIKLIKMYAWETPVSIILSKLRLPELKALVKRNHLSGFNIAMMQPVTQAAVFITLAVCIYQKNLITPAKTFFLVALLGDLIKNVFYVLPYGLGGVGELYVSLTRIQRYLLLDEYKLRKNSERRVQQTKPQDSFVSITAAWVQWTNEKYSLKDINLGIGGDNLVVVAGTVGSGKSTLLNLILQELSVTHGQCQVTGKVAFASQDAWIFASSIRQNVILGQDFDEERYKWALHATALEEDIKKFDGNDMSLVGERGVTLSGGQRARLNLARCLYQQADIYLLDDPLSSVDTRVGRHIFKSIKEGMRGKLKVLVTHQIQYLQDADHIILLNEGLIVCQGTYEQVLKLPKARSMTQQNGLKCTFQNVNNNDPLPTTLVKTDEEVSIKLCVQTDTEISASSNTSKGNILWRYLCMARSPLYLAAVLLTSILCQATVSLSNWWLAYWTKLESRNQNDDMYHLIFLSFVAAVFLTNILRSVTLFTLCSKISHNLHNSMVSGLMGTSPRFFDKNTAGRIMNRFTNDLSSVDDSLSLKIYDVIIIFSHVIGSNILIIVSNYVLVLPTLAVAALLIFIWRFYAATSIDVKFMEAVAKGPMLTQSTTSFLGLSSIRSAQVESNLIREFDALQNNHTTAWFVFASAARAFSIWVEIICVIYLTIISFTFLFMQDSISSSYAGLAIISALRITDWLQLGLRQCSDAENLLTSVKRCLDYASLEPEQSCTTDKLSPDNWPTEGKIEFRGVTLEHEEVPVLNSISFEIQPTEKIGIVGRTGAGKSSLITALFRMAQYEGDILIDGMNTNDVSLPMLRKCITIIPQDPILFSGSIRFNLDPFGEFNDGELWRVLEEVHLKSIIQSLDDLVADQGSNFSVGQRQLFCLARAILRKNKIIVLDEATASVDPRTESLIQATIYEKFANCTIICIAHRLHSVIDCDRIIVLEKGSIKEFGPPKDLLLNPAGYLAGLLDNKNEKC